MRSVLRLGYALWLGSFGSFSAFGALGACSTSNGSASVSPQPATGDDGGTATTDAPTSTTQDSSSAQDGSSTDAGADVEQPLTIANEVEPNGGTPVTAVNAMVLPGTMNGKIDPANDVDIFSIQLAPGDFWEWTATPTSADLAPHLIIFDTNSAGMNPTVAGFAAAGSTAKVQHFVLSAGTFVAGMRDARNVPTATGKGGPTYGYALTGKRATPAPIAVTFPVIKQGKLASIGSVDLYTFTGTGGKGFDVFVRAPNVASTIDSRLSIFDIPAKTVIGINDDVASTPDNRDTQLGGASPANSTYMVVVENEGTNGADLSYEIEFKLR
jgi:hypothetical protein